MWLLGKLSEADKGFRVCTGLDLAVGQPLLLPPLLNLDKKNTRSFGEEKPNRRPYAHTVSKL